MNESQPPLSSRTSEPNGLPRPLFREMATEAIRYWEPRRLIYNAALGFVVLWHFLAHWPEARSLITFNATLFLFLLAVLANCCYCAGYIPDLFAQYTGIREVWLRIRVWLLLLGIAFAAVVTHFFCLAFFAQLPPLPV